MFGKIKSLMKSRKDAVEQETHFLPSQPFFAIGDIHGCYDVLEKLISEMEVVANGDEKMVFLGDAIDRGPDSAKVLQKLFELAQKNSENTIVLMGNHERMMLDFIDDPSMSGERWLVNGGKETLESYKIPVLSTNTEAEDAMELADMLEAALPDGMLDWLRSLPLMWTSGNMCCVHAAMNPDKSPEAQSDRTLLWGHKEFLKRPRQDGITVVHGHTIFSSPMIGNSRVSIDTGAYHSGTLTAVRVSENDCKVLQAHTA